MNKTTTRPQSNYKQQIPTIQPLVNQKENLLDLDKEFKSIGEVMQQLGNRNEQVALQKVANLIREEQDKYTKKLNSTKEAYEKKIKALEDN